MPLTIGFQDYKYAKLALAGNNFVLSNGSSIAGQTFMTLAETTTATNTLSGSDTILNIPTGSTVIFAELVLGAISFSSTTGSFTFSTPVTTVTLPYSNIITDGFTSSHQNITTLVQNGGSGTYSVSGVTGNVQCSAWSMAVIYEDKVNFPLNYIVYHRGCVGPFSSMTFNNVFTPLSGPIEAYFSTFTTGSDINDNGVVRLNGVQLGNASNPWNGLAPYNKNNNLFPGIFCIANPSESSFGLLDTRGTFGTANNDPYTGTYPIPHKTWADLAGFDVSNILTNGQSTATLTESYTGGWYTNIVAFQTNTQLPVINVVKSSDTTLATNNSIVTYTLVISNTGNYAGTNIKIFDTLPAQLSFIANSIEIDNVQMPGLTLTPPNGITLQTLPASGVSTITFKASVINTSTSIVNNSAQLLHNFSGTNFSAVSNTVPLNLIAAPVSISKSVSKTYATKNNTLIYTLIVTNLTTIPISPTVIDTLPNNLSFINGSLTINNTPSSENPTVSPGVLINNLAGNATTTLIFSTSIVLPLNNLTVTNSGNVYLSSPFSYTRSSNIVTTTITYIEFVLNKIVDKNFSFLNDTLTYSIEIKNTGNISATTFLIDTLPTELTYITNSLKQDNTTITSGISGNFLVTLPNVIQPNTTSTITFKASVNSVPSSSQILNTATASSNFTAYPTLPNGETYTAGSNTTLTTISNVDLSSLKKAVDKVFTIPGDIITYTITTKNTGNVPAFNVVFFDTIPPNTTFIPNSATLNGGSVTSNPQSGITIGTILPNTTITITFKVSINTA